MTNNHTPRCIGSLSAAVHIELTKHCLLLQCKEKYAHQKNVLLIYQ